MFQQGGHVDEYLAQVIAQFIEKFLDALDVLEHVFSIVNQRRYSVYGLGELPQNGNLSLGFRDKLVTLKHLHPELILIHLLLFVRHVFYVFIARILPSMTLRKLETIFL